MTDAASHDDHTIGSSPGAALVPVRIAPALPAVVDAALVLADAPAALSPNTVSRIRRAKAASTRRAYSRQWDEFETWCLAQRLRPLPASAETFTEYVSALCDRGLAPATIEQAMAAIRTRHKQQGFLGQPETSGAVDVLTTHSRERAEKGIVKRQAPAVTVALVRQMAAVCDPESTAGLRDRVIVVLGYAGMLRRSELARLNLADVADTDDGLILTIRTSKTDQAGQGATVHIPPGSHPDTDPVRVVRAWTAHLAARGITDGRLIRSVSRSGHIGPTISGTAINDAVGRIAERAGIKDHHLYTAHGLRAGGPTDAARRGVPAAHIAEHGRWSPQGRQVHEYVRVADKWRDNPMVGSGL